MFMFAVCGFHSTVSYHPSEANSKKRCHFSWEIVSKEPRKQKRQDRQTVAGPSDALQQCIGDIGVLMELMQHENLRYLAVSLGFYKTLFSAPGTSTSSEIPEEEQLKMGLSDGIIRFSIGLDNDIERTYRAMRKCMKQVGVL